MAIATEESTVGRSHAMTLDRFGTAEAAARYPSVYGTRRRHRRERETILLTFRHIPDGARVLDLPCGTGRVTRLLLEHGFHVTAADASEPMVRLARENHRQFQGDTSPAPDATFEVRDVMQTGYANDRFDAVFCNRLLHHFSEPATRRTALAELRRVCTGPLIVSFFNAFSLDAAAFRLRHFIRRTTPNDRIPISLQTFAADATDAGLRIEATLPVRWGISPQWYVVLRRA